MKTTSSEHANLKQQNRSRLFMCGRYWGGVAPALGVLARCGVGGEALGELIEGAGDRFEMTCSLPRSAFKRPRMLVTTVTCQHENVIHC